MNHNLKNINFPVFMTVCLVTAFFCQSRTLGDLGEETLEFKAGKLTLKLAESSQTATGLLPDGAGGFDFTPSDRLAMRSGDGFYHLGDITLRVRKGDSGEWMRYATAIARRPVNALPAAGQVLAAADLSSTLPDECPLRIVRQWGNEEGHLTLSFDLTNTTENPVQIGALGIPMIFNNIITRRSLEEAHEVCSFFDPYIGADAGYLQVTRLSGHGPALVVVPLADTPFEAYHLLKEPIRPQQTFEGSFEWMVHSRAYAENEWQGVKQWNEPTLAILKPGETKRYGVKFLVTDEIRQIEKTLLADKRPAAVGIPGYILPMDIEGKVFLNYRKPVKKIEVEPENAIAVSLNDSVEFLKSPGAQSWASYSLRGKCWGRCRVTITYEDGLRQTIHYYITKPSVEAVSDMGRFLLTKQWFEKPGDPFDRSPSVITYDIEEDRQHTQDNRVWIAGLGDEGGSGSWLAAGMKQFVLPNREEIAKYERFIDETLWGGLQYSEGDNKYGVRKSMLYYAPEEMPEGTYRSDINWEVWSSWNKKAAQSIGRGYNYPHVAAVYWSLYRLARHHNGLVKNHPWQWYLEQAYETSRFLSSRRDNDRYRVGYADKGLMEGTIFIMVLEDLKREGWDDKASLLEEQMKHRTDHWIEQPYPFGSEMAWDSTGQEEVYGWCKYFGYDEKALVSLNSILGYMPTVPHWGYNGNARRYWDFLYAGKLQRIERQIHHYGSGLNAIPVLQEYRENPDDFYLLLVGYGGAMGALSNINQEGFASAAFHSYPSTLKWDGINGDYGSHFFGYAVNTATYIINHPVFGWQAFGGNVEVTDRQVQVTPLDSLRQRVYIAPLGLWLTLDAGTFSEIVIDNRKKTCRLALSPASSYTPKAYLRIEQPARRDDIGVYQPTTSYNIFRDCFEIPLSSQPTRITLAP